MKKFIKFIFFLIIVGVGVYIYANYFSAEEALTPDQEEIQKTFGPAQEFAITYIPRGSGPDLAMVRNETWYYPKQQKKITFLGGRILAVEDFTPAEELISSTSLRPEDFSFFMDYQEVADALGSANVEPLDFLPGFFEESGVKTYASDKAVFMIEDNQLVYFQTIGLGAGDGLPAE